MKQTKATCLSSNKRPESKVKVEAGVQNIRLLLCLKYHQPEKEDVMWLVIRILMWLFFLVPEARAALTTETKNTADTWIAFAVGKPYINTDGYSVKVYPAKSTSELMALTRARTKCQEEAENCFVLPSLTTKRLCRFVVVTFENGVARWVKAPSPEKLQIMCMGRFTGECSKPAGGCN
jgi:hypothetical protein